MGEFDELVSRDGVLVAGRFGPDGRVAEHKSTSLFTRPWANTRLPSTVTGSRSGRPSTSGAPMNCSTCYVKQDPERPSEACISAFA